MFKQYMNSKYNHAILQLWVKINKMLKWAVAGHYEGK